MLKVGLAFAALILGASTLAHAAGLQSIDVAAGNDGPDLKGAVWYPCTAKPEEVRLSGLLAVQAVKDCPIAGEKLPLIVISHGRVGTFAGHHDLAESLADAGFIVAAISHTGDTATDMSRTDDLSILVERPADIRRLVDFMLGPWPGAPKIDAGRIGFFGFSRGGYTGLVLIGGKPDFRKGLALCPPDAKIRMCEQLHESTTFAAPPQDPRIKAAVIADPAFAFLFDRETLKDVKVPVDLWASAQGGDGVTQESVAAIERALPTKPAYHIAENAGHFAFLAPCTPEEAKARPPFLCTDPPGFDRVEFHMALDGDVAAFFKRHLATQ
jgi:predicted dienelactone hydrolase